MATDGRELPFSKEEYGERLDKVRQSMDEKQIDLLYVTSPANLCYLTGHELIWYFDASPSGLAIPQSSDEVLFFDSATHKSHVLQETILEDGVFLDRDQGLDTILSELNARRWLQGTVGFEEWSWAPSAVTQANVRASMESAGANVVDGSWIVDDIRLIKSPKEIEYVRKAAFIADQTMKAARDAIQPGVTELEVEGQIQLTMAKLGGEDAAIRHMVHSGPRSSYYHSATSRRVIQQGEIVWVDFCASYNRYHADLSRTFSVGEPDPSRVELLHRAAGSLDKVLESVKPGDPITNAQAAADEYIDSQELRDYVWWIGGYALGVGIPPDWVGHVYLGQETYARRTDIEEYKFLPGMVSNYENLFQLPEERWGGGYIETILMTENGLEVLSKLSRDLTTV